MEARSSHTESQGTEDRVIDACLQTRTYGVPYAGGSAGNTITFTHQTSIPLLSQNIPISHLRSHRNEVL